MFGVWGSPSGASPRVKWGWSGIDGFCWSSSTRVAIMTLRDGPTQGRLVSIGKIVDSTARCIQAAAVMCVTHKLLTLTTRRSEWPSFYISSNVSHIYYFDIIFIQGCRCFSCISWNSSMLFVILDVCSMSSLVLIYIFEYFFCGFFLFFCLFYLYSYIFLHNWAFDLPSSNFFVCLSHGFMKMSISMQFFCFFTFIYNLFTSLDRLPKSDLAFERLFGFE